MQIIFQVYLFGSKIEKLFSKNNQLNKFYLLSLVMIRMVKQTLSLNEEEIIQDMSTMFKLFKNQFLTIEKISILNIHYDFKMQSPEDLEKLEIQCKSILKQQQKIIQKLRQYNKYLSIFKMIFSRLFSRLVQLIHYYKQKHNNTKQDFKEYCQSIQIIIFNTISDEDVNYFESLVEICEIGKKYIIKLLMYSNEQQFNQIIFDKKCINSVKSEIITMPNKYQNKLNDVFQNLKLLNLDYQGFKTTFYNSRSQQNHLYNEMYQRNESINQEIMSYRKSYGYYKLRKNKLNRKTRPKNISLITSILRKISHKTKQSQTSNTSSYNPQVSVHSQDITQILSSKIIQTKKKTNYIQRKNLNKTLSHAFQRNEQKKTPKLTEIPLIQQKPFKITSKNSNQTKKITSKMHKFSLKSRDEQQKQFHKFVKKKYTVLSNDRKRISGNFEGIIQGHRLNELEARRYQIQSSIQKSIGFNLFL